MKPIFELENTISEILNKKIVSEENGDKSDKAYAIFTKEIAIPINKLEKQFRDLFNGDEAYEIFKDKKLEIACSVALATAGQEFAKKILQAEKDKEVREIIGHYLMGYLVPLSKGKLSKSSAESLVKSWLK